ncbi:MAG: aminotransferase class III-fold pyridoxal phosphate-dependent enzyme [Gemmatimonadota bacterium]
MIIPGFSSTGSKRPDALYGPGDLDGLPVRMTRSRGCTVWDEQDREYLDFIMALGAVALGYGYPAVNRAAQEAIESGVVGSLAPVHEEALAQELKRRIPLLDQVRFLKTGAEAVAAAVRIGRASTGRDGVLGCGYHGWLDWCQVDDPAVPSGTRASFQALRFNDPGDARKQIRALATKLAAVVIEPVIDAAPSTEWLQTLRDETTAVGAVLIFDEIKTGCRLAVGGAAERYAVEPDLMVMGKALANGFPLALVGGRSSVMEAAARTWISSTLATEMVSLAAARVTLELIAAAHVPARLTESGNQLWLGLTRLKELHPNLISEVRGVPEMCFLEYRGEDTGAAVTRGAARRGLLFKRNAYNFVSLAHHRADIETALGILGEVLKELTC